MKHRTIALSALSLILAAGASAQDVQPAAEAPRATLVAAPEVRVSSSDTEIEKAANMLLGTWITAEPVGELGSDGSAKIVMTIGPAKVEGLSDVLYVETAREGELATPYRQALYQFYRYKGGLRLRTLELRSEQSGQALLGTGMVPDAYAAAVGAGDVYPTIDIDLAPKAGGFAGHSPGAYPDHRGGAVQMTSAIAFDGDSIRITDVGYDSEGNVAWEVGRDGGVEFARAEGLVGVQRYDDGLIIVSFEEPEGEKIQDGDWMVIHYTGKLTDGSKFDSSYDRAEPFRYKTPGSLIQGWLRGTAEMAKGSRRRLIIPPALGYGDRPVGPIPPGSTLVFDVECVFIEKDVPAPAPAEGTATPEGE